ncbi:molecular chaperone DnaK [Roseivirga sp. 4D4]|uniref:DUF4331 family protein n=1 Tax=Roseivirga sp. 4D4 TaxID=1889784 RepID=UPI0008535895|nr:molecular chaperone DnaK [Roseivirga sp. 4D4]
MKRKITFMTALLAIATSIYLIAADHNEALGVQDTGSDIADLFAYQSPQNSNNLVFAATVQGLLSPSATANAQFDENVMIEFNIDNDGDAIEDLVIQCIFENGQVYAYGPYAPMSTGLNSSIDTNASLAQADITPYGSNAVVGSNNGVSVFAGPRDDPFFFDFAQFGAILGGNATSFNDPGNDSFAGTNVLAVVVEVPKSMVGTGDSINTWVETKRKQ